MKNEAKLEVFYLSFADEEGFRGVCLVEAFDAIDAVQRAHRLKINPGGQVMITHIPRAAYVSARNRLPVNVLMNKEKLIALGGPVLELGEMHAMQRAKVAEGSDMVCPEHNNPDDLQHTRPLTTDPKPS